MEKISVAIIIVMFCLFALVGCNRAANTDTNNSGGNDIEIEGPHTVGPHLIEIENENDYTGSWINIDNPNDYYLTITGQRENTIDLEITAVRNEGFQIADARITDIELTEGIGAFTFEDSFGNTGDCDISISDGILNLNYYNMEYQWGWCIDAGAGDYKKDDMILCEYAPKDSDLILNDSFYAKVPKNRYGGSSEEGDYAPGEFLLWLSPMDVTDDGYLVRNSSIAVPYIVSDDGNSENLSILSGGNDGTDPYGDSIFFFTTDSSGEIIDVIHAEESELK